MGAEPIREGDGYECLLPSIPLPPIIKIDFAILPEFWADFCVKHRIVPFAVLAYENPLGQMKLWGARSILESGIRSGTYRGTDTVIDSTSGNFAEAVAWLLDEIRKQDASFPIKHVKAVAPHSTPRDKIKRLENRGIDVIYADSSLKAMNVARDEAEKHNWWYLQQYWNMANAKGYIPIAQHIMNLRPNLGAMACGVGSGGSCSGIMSALVHAPRAHRQGKAHRVAVVVEAGESVDGVRTEEALEPGTLPWRKCVDDVRFVGEQRSLECSAALWQQQKFGEEWCAGGPSTGFALEGGLLSLRSLAAMGKLDPLRNPAGDVEYAFLAPDKRDPYEKKYKKRAIYF